MFATLIVSHLRYVDVGIGRASGWGMNTILDPVVIYVRPSCTDFARLLPGQPKYIARAMPAVIGFERWEGTGMDQFEAAESLCSKLRKAGVKNNLTEGHALTLIPETALQNRN